MDLAWVIHCLDYCVKFNQKNKSKYKFLWGYSILLFPIQNIVVDDITVFLNIDKGSFVYFFISCLISQTWRKIIFHQDKSDIKQILYGVRESPSVQGYRWWPTVPGVPERGEGSSCWKSSFIQWTHDDANQIFSCFYSFF